MDKPIGIGFVGAGTNTRLMHLPGFAAIEGVRLVTVANRSEASSRAVADAFGVARTAPDWRAVVADPEVDAVCIGTWPYLHAEVTIAALAAGKHVLTEARMACDADQGRAMLAASQARQDLVAQVVPAPFTLELDSTIIEILRSGRLGEVREVLVDHATGAYLDPAAPLTWRQDPRYSGHNILMMGIFHEMVQRWLPGPFGVASALGATFTRQRVHWETGERVDVEIPDCVHITGWTGGGALFDYRFSGVEPGPGRNDIRMVGSQATLRVDVAGKRLFIGGRDGREQALEVPDAARRGWRVEADFIDSIRTGAPVRLTSFADGVRYMEFTDAVYESLRG